MACDLRDGFDWCREEGGWRESGRRSKAKEEIWFEGLWCVEERARKGRRSEWVGGRREVVGATSA